MDEEEKKRLKAAADELEKLTEGYDVRAIPFTNFIFDHITQALNEINNKATALTVVVQNLEERLARLEEPKE